MHFFRSKECFVLDIYFGMALCKLVIFNEVLFCTHTYLSCEKNSLRQWVTHFCVISLLENHLKKFPRRVLPTRKFIKH